MQKKQNPRNPKYNSFTISRDSFVDLGRMDRMDRLQQPCISSAKPSVGFNVNGFYTKKKGRLEYFLHCAVKRSLDISFSIIIILFIVSWMTVLLSVLLKLGGGGPFFFIEKRDKGRKRLFSAIRFSTEIPGKRMALEASGYFNLHASRIGRFMISHRLDNLPQFINVLIGDMSVIGPKSYPHNESLTYEHQIPGYYRRYGVRPGIFSLESLYNLPGEPGSIRNMSSKTRMDLFYNNHWSPCMDVKIILRLLSKMTGLGLIYPKIISGRLLEEII